MKYRARGEGANVQVSATTGTINYANMDPPLVGVTAGVSPGPIVGYFA